MVSPQLTGPQGFKVINGGAFQEDQQEVRQGGGIPSGPPVWLHPLHATEAPLTFSCWCWNCENKVNKAKNIWQLVTVWPIQGFPWCRLQLLLPVCIWVNEVLHFFPFWLQHGQINILCHQDIIEMCFALLRAFQACPAGFSSKGFCWFIWASTARVCVVAFSWSSTASRLKFEQPFTKAVSFSLPRFV